MLVAAAPATLSNTAIATDDSGSYLPSKENKTRLDSQFGSLGRTWVGGMLGSSVEPGRHPG